MSQVCAPRGKAIEGLAQGYALEEPAGKPSSWPTPGPVLPSSAFPLTTGGEIKLKVYRIDLYFISYYA